MSKASRSRPARGAVLDPDRSQRKTSALLPTGHVVRIGEVEMTGTGEPAQEARTHLCYTAARTSGVSAAISEK